MCMRHSVEFVEHPGEVRLRLSGRSLGELAAVGGRALAELESAGRLDDGAGEWRQVAVSGRDAAALLVNWLNELIYLAEAERWIGVDFRLVNASETRLAMRVRGVTVDVAPTAVKAATLHGLHVTNVPGGVTADIVLDV